MMCKKPFMRVPVAKLGHFFAGEEGRLAAMAFPCGLCLPCRINKRRIWQNRILLESMAHAENCFVTLTYNDEHLPGDGSVHKREMQLFMKKLRRKLEPLEVRFFCVGEYGSKKDRPHYHLILFGVDPFLGEKAVKKVWTEGFFSVSEFSPGRAGYIAGYCVKKMTRFDNEYQKEYLGIRRPEFMTCSRRPGIGAPGLKMVVEKIKNNKFWDGRVPRLLKHGKHHLPLGGFLRLKLAEMLGVEADVMEHDQYEWQSEFFYNNVMPHIVMRDQVITMSRVSRDNLYQNSKVFPKRRILHGETQ